MAVPKLKPWLRRRLRPTPSKLSSGSRETCAITVERAKTAALCFDRVYTSDKTAPYEIAVTEWSVAFDAFGNPQEISVKAPTQHGVVVHNSPETLFYNIRTFPGGLLKAISKRGLAPTIYYEAERDLDKDLFGKGDYRAVGIALSNLEIVSEEKLEWEQVVEFRSDKDSQQSYLRLMRWYDEQVGEGKTLAEIEDKIALTLNDYRESLKKHGIHTFVGPVAAWIGGPLAVNSVAAALMSVVGQLPSEWVASVTLGAGVAGCTAKLRSVQLDRRNAKRQPLAYAHKLSQLSKRKT